MFGRLQTGKTYFFCSRALKFLRGLSVLVILLLYVPCVLLLRVAVSAACDEPASLESKELEQLSLSLVVCVPSWVRSSHNVVVLKRCRECTCLVSRQLATVQTEVGLVTTLRYTVTVLACQTPLDRRSEPDCSISNFQGRTIRAFQDSPGRVTAPPISALSSLPPIGDS